GVVSLAGSSLIALTWPTDSAVPHQSNHDTAYLLQSPSNSPPGKTLRGDGNDTAGSSWWNGVFESWRGGYGKCI
ncbi:hypothetical protein NQZ68_039726, partial [Dissostichus eleginoides]